MEENIDWDITIEKLMDGITQHKLDKEQLSALTEVIRSINTMKLIQFYSKEAIVYEYISNLFLKNEGHTKEKCVELIKEHAEDILEIISKTTDEIKPFGGQDGE